MKLQAIIRELLKELGEDPEREGLRETPERVEKSLRYLTKGYKEDPKEILGRTFEVKGYDEMIVVKDIDFFSLCEHHLLPFFGKVHIGYIPKDKVVGISKIARLVEVFSRRLQIQERLTTEIAETLMEHINPLGVGVVCEAVHLCMMMRGVEKQNSVIQTSAMLGVFRKRAETRHEFLTLIGSNKPLK
mgnify:CR=1 FL=1